MSCLLFRFRSRSSKEYLTRQKFYYLTPSDVQIIFHISVLSGNFRPELPSDISRDKIKLFTRENNPANNRIRNDGP
jgi:hypothetical protein